MPHLLRIALVLAALLVLAAMPALTQTRILVPSDSAATAPSDGMFWRIDEEELGPAWPTYDPVRERHVEQILAAMSDEERVAQLLMISWPGEVPTGEILRWVRERNLGGIKIFGWNGENLPTLTRAIRDLQEDSLATATGIPLFTATDQEGGWVRHIKGGTSITPGNMAIGASGLPHDALMTGRYIGMELRALGVNMNFAPTVDVYINPEAHVIGPRAFSADPVQSGILGVAFYRGQEQAGVMATAKHFPGHGNASGDSHGMLPVIMDDWETVWNRDLVPFRMLVRENVPAVLSGHLSFPTITGSNAPASISPYFKTEVLRDRLGFQGVVITDDLYMGGALEYGQAQGWSFAELVKRAIEAGNDIVMLSQTPAFNGEIWNTLITAYREEEAFRARVDESVRRILHIKIAYLLPEWRVPLFPDTTAFSEFVRMPEAQEFFLDQAARGVTVIRDAQIPYQPAPGERILLAGKDPTFFRAGRARYRGADEFRFAGLGFYASNAEDRARFAARVGAYDTVIFLLSDPATVQILEAGRRAAEQAGTRVIVYSTLTPIYLATMPWVESALAVYGWGTESYEAGFAALAGDTHAPGRLPVQFEPPR